MLSAARDIQNIKNKFGSIGVANRRGRSRRSRNRRSLLDIQDSIVTVSACSVSLFYT